MSGKNFADMLLDAVEEKKNPSVVGLDPRIETIPKECWSSQWSNYDKRTADVIFNFNKKIIDAIKDVVPAVKPNIAFYELYGAEGIRAFNETVKYAQGEKLMVIADAKRNDIGSTAEAYSSAFLGKKKCLSDSSELVEIPGFECDSLTVNAYLGIDGVKPFIEDSKKYGKGLFALVKTSNKSSGDFQDEPVILDKNDCETILKRTKGTEFGEYKKMVMDSLPKERMVPLGINTELVYPRIVPNYIKMALNVSRWGEGTDGEYGYQIIGAVVGATYPREAELLRKMMPKNIFLVPGYGAQGGGAKEVVPSFNKDGKGAIVNSSRGIIFAYLDNKYKGYSFDGAAHQAALDMKSDITTALRDAGRGSW